jgi:hypothetical protein
VGRSVRVGVGKLVNCAGLNDPVAALAGHGSNEIEVSVVVEQREVVCFCDGCDEEVKDLLLRWLRWASKR